MVRDVPAIVRVRSRRTRNLQDCERRLEYVSGMGFDVLYLPPVLVLSVARTIRVRTNIESALTKDVGSPWAIGSKEGGHEAIHPELGTLGFPPIHGFAQRNSDWRWPWTLRSSAHWTTPTYWNTRNSSRTATVACGIPKTLLKRPRTSTRCISKMSTTASSGGIPKCGAVLDRTGHPHLPRGQPSH